MTQRPQFRSHAWLAALVIAAAGCSAWRPGAPVKLPQATSTVLEQLIVYSDSSLPQRHRLLEELNAQRQLLCTRLNLAARTSGSTFICSTAPTS